MGRTNTVETAEHERPAARAATALQDEIAKTLVLEFPAIPPRRLDEVAARVAATVCEANAAEHELTAQAWRLEAEAATEQAIACKRERIGGA